MKEIEDLGWANGWDEVPEIVKKCQILRHSPIEENHDSYSLSSRNLITSVRCDKCGYVYKYDSSD